MAAGRAAFRANSTPMGLPEMLLPGFARFRLPTIFDIMIANIDSTQHYE